MQQWIAEKREQLDDPFWIETYRDFDSAYEWDPADPRIEQLAETFAETAPQSATTDPDDPGQVIDYDQFTSRLIWDHVCAASPAWRRIYELVERRLGPRETWAPPEEPARH